LQHDDLVFSFRFSGVFGLSSNDAVEDLLSRSEGVSLPRLAMEHFAPGPAFLSDPDATGEYFEPDPIESVPRALSTAPHKYVHKKSPLPQGEG
jgi:hypothetical protein